MNFRDILMAAATQSSGSAAVAPQASWPSLIGAEMMVNGDCSFSNGWTLGGGVVIAAAKMTATAATSTTLNDGVASGTFVAGGTYRNVFTIDTLSVGTARMKIGSNGAARSAADTYSQDLVAADGDAWSLVMSSATMQLDNFSVKSVGLNGLQSDWTFGGDGGWTSGSLNTATSNDFSFTLNGTAAASFDAGVSNTTACTVTLTEEPDYGSSGPVLVSLKGGTPVEFNFVAGVAAPHTVTSGTGSSILIEDNGVDGADVRIVRIQISLA